MSDTELQIRKKYSKWYPDLENPVSDEEIQLLIDHECQCDSCGTSIFDLDEFPETYVKHDVVMCEECYGNKYHELCPICENTYNTIDGNTDFFVINEELGKEIKLIPGIYRILQSPFFYGGGVFGFDNFISENIELVTPIRINEYKEINCGVNDPGVFSDHICPECIDKYTKTTEWATLEPAYCIILEKYRYEMFSECSDEEIHQRRQNMVHRRITLKGMMEKATDKNFKRKKPSKP